MTNKKMHLQTCKACNQPMQVVEILNGVYQETVCLNPTCFKYDDPLNLKDYDND